MSISSGARTRLLYVAEVTAGTTPGSPTMIVLRSNSRVINQKKTLLESAEIRSDRQVVFARHGMQSAEGSIPFELAIQDYDDWLEAALGGTWASVGISGSPDLQATATGSIFTRATGSFITDDIRAGDVIVTTGFTNGANNGNFRVTAVTATTIAVVAVDGTAASLVDEASAAARDINLVGQRLDIGTTLYTFSVEREFSDLAKYEHFAGVFVNALSMNIAPEAIVTGSLELMAMAYNGFGAQLDGTPTEPQDRDPLVSFDARAVWEGDASTLSIVTGVDFQLNNGRKLVPVVARQNAYAIAEGSARITGNLRTLYEDETQLDKFTNETESSLATYLDDPQDATKFLNIVFPRIKYTGGDIEPPAEQETVITFPWIALKDTVTGVMMSIQRNN